MLLEKKQNNRKNIISLIAVALFLVVVLILDQVILPTNKMSMLLTVLQKGSVYALAAVSMNLLNGFTGLFSLGHAGFMLLGAYTYAIFTIPNAVRDTVYMYYDAAIRFSFPEMLRNSMGSLGTVLGVIIAVLLAGLVAAFFAWLIGLPVLKLKSDYLAIATLGFAEILRAFFQWNALGPITNGSNLLKSYPAFSHATPYVVLGGLMIAVILLIINSTYGRAFKAIRDDEVAAEAMGINLAKHKRMSFITSSFFAGIGGGMMAMYMGAIAAAPFKSTLTYEILLIVVIGGIGSVSGSILASFLYIFSSEWLLRGLDSGTFLGINAPGIFKNGFRMAVISVIIMVVVLFFSKGIMGDKEISFRKLAERIVNGKKSRETAEGGENNG